MKLVDYFDIYAQKHLMKIDIKTTTFGWLYKHTAEFPQNYYNCLQTTYQDVVLVKIVLNER